jgi:hypothetical protein
MSSDTMPKAEIKEPKEEAKKVKVSDKKIAKIIGDKVMEKLGTPSNFSHADAPIVGENCFRVNIWCWSGSETDAVRTRRISDSFYIRTSVDGEKIEYSSPEIKKRYK